MQRGGIMLAGLAAMLAGCATDGSQTPRSQQLWTAQGEPVSCIVTNQIRSTHVVDDRTINFVMSGRNRMFRNDLPAACPGLSFNRTFKHNSRTGRLCNVDTITVIQNGRRGAICGLGRFQPMVPIEAATPIVPAAAATPIVPAAAATPAPN
jgi:hypothetical protein